MRHIPEDELHAYLDQGLSRSQCVEIESHLAECGSCRAVRDGIAALRDRTTALLARLGPPRKVPPAFELIRRCAAAQESERRRRTRGVLWAASLVAAVAFGWSASYLLGPGAAGRVMPPPMISTEAPQPRLPAAVLSPPVTKAIERSPSRSVDGPPVAPPPPTAPGREPLAAAATPGEASRPDPSRATFDHETALAVLQTAPAVELSPVATPRGGSDVHFDGVWRTMSWDGAQAEAGQPLPHINGLPVVQVQVQGGEQGKRPLMVVAQQLSSGEVIRTIEGPATDVSNLLAHRSMSDPDPRLPGIADSGSFTFDSTDHTMAMQLGDRMLAITGALPSDSLRAMIRRLNAQMRSK